MSISKLASKLDVSKLISKSSQAYLESSLRIVIHLVFTRIQTLKTSIRLLQRLYPSYQKEVINWFNHNPFSV